MECYGSRKGLMQTALTRKILGQKFASPGTSSGRTEKVDMTLNVVSPTRPNTLWPNPVAVWLLGYRIKPERCRFETR